MASEPTATEFTIRGEFITLGQLLKAADIVTSGGEVKDFLLESGITVNDESEERRGKKLRPGDIVKFPNGSTVTIR
jgi:ribosome-associated protein